MDPSQPLPLIEAEPFWGIYVCYLQKIKHEYYLRERAVIIHSISEPIITHFPPIWLLWGKSFSVPCSWEATQLLEWGLPVASWPRPWTPPLHFSLSGLGRVLARPACVGLTDWHRDTETCIRLKLKAWEGLNIEKTAKGKNELSPWKGQIFSSCFQKNGKFWKIFLQTKDLLSSPCAQDDLHFLNI